MCLEYGECGVTVAHAPWEGGEQFNSDIFHHLLTNIIQINPFKRFWWLTLITTNIGVWCNWQHDGL